MFLVLSKQRDRSLDHYIDEKKFRKDFHYKIKSSEGSKTTREDGNKLLKSQIHSKLIHEEILSMYSKSIALAPSSSEELAFGYGNRSYLLFHLEKYQESIIDCNYALQVEVISKLFKFKILCRKVSCFTLLDKKFEAQKNFDEAKILLDNINDKPDAKDKLFKDLKDAISQKPITNQTSDKFSKNISNSLPYLSDAISLANNTKFGNHIIAKKKIQTSDIVLIDKAYCTYPNLKKLYIACSHCLKRFWNGIPCKNCVFVMYCSNECRSEAWKKYHDLECYTYPFLFSHNILYSDELFLLRLFIKAMKEIGMDGLINNLKLDDNKKFSKKEMLVACNTFKFCYYLSEKEKYDELENEESIESSISVVLKALQVTPIFDKLKLEYYDQEKIKKILYKLQSMCSINGFEVEVSGIDDILDSINDSSVSRSLGLILNSVSCFFNHSCYPNVDAIKLEGGRMLFYALRPIDKNEQLFFSYGPTINSSTEERRHTLQKRYNFICSCIACKKKWPLGMDLQSSLKGNKITMDFMELLKKKNLPLSELSKNPTWIYREDALKLISEFLDYLNPNFSNSQVSNLVLCFNNYLNMTFYSIYGSKFIIPNNCKFKYVIVLRKIVICIFILFFIIIIYFHFFFDK